MSNYTNSGTLTTNASTNWVSVRGWVTVAVHGTWDTSTMTWKFKGVDGTERTITVGADGSCTNMTITDIFLSGGICTAYTCVDGGNTFGFIFGQSQTGGVGRSMGLVSFY